MPAPQGASTSIATWNVNGLRATRSSFVRWMGDRAPAVACVQETRLGHDTARRAEVPGYRAFFNHSDRAGHSGTALYARIGVTQVALDVLGDQGDSRGRSILVELPTVRVLNVYMPHGGRDGSRLAHKFQMYEALLALAAEDSDPPLVIAGDMNIAHHDIDLRRPSQNRRNTMFTAPERALLDRLIDLGYVDAFRHLHPHCQSFSWWPYMSDCRERDIGWRIDQILVHHTIAPRVTGCRIDADVLGSDHCPVTVTLSGQP